MAAAVLQSLDTGCYRDRSDQRTQDIRPHEIAEAACFLGFDGLIASSARWDCLNLVLFTGRLPPAIPRP
ncbi:MAG: hypothetical protein FJX52_17180 [Alphaproteobacteria bacterium]|nr:hypothetical protein [Alphaproteobacteria bacterium]